MCRDCATLCPRDSLDNLILSGTGISDAAVDALSGMEIRRLNLDSTAISDHAIEMLSKVRGLQALFLFDTSVTDGAFPGLSVLEDLRFLALSGTEVTDQGTAHLASLPNLGELHIYQNPGIGNETLRWAAEHSTLHTLFIGYTQVTDEGLEHLLGSGITHIEVIDCPGITDRGIETLSRVETLDSLNLSSLSITDEGLAHLERLPNIVFLDVHDTPLTDNCLLTLESFQKLTVLRIYDTQISPEGAQRLHESLPHCQIVWDGGTLGPGATIDVSTTDAFLQLEPGDTIDLLQYVDTQRDTEAGTWTLNEGVLQSSGTVLERLGVPVTIDGGYELSVEFTRTSGDDAVAILFPAGEGAALFHLDAWKDYGGITDVAGIEGSSPNNITSRLGLLENGRIYEVTLRVELEGENAHVRVLLDGEPYTEFDGPQSDLTQSRLGHNQSAFHWVRFIRFISCIRGAELRLLDGTARVLQGYHDHQIAEWLIDNGGLVFSQVGSRSRAFESRNELPAEHFALTAISMINNPNIESIDFSRLALLPQLNNYGAQASRFDDDDLAQLAEIPSIRTLVLNGTLISDVGMVHLQKLRLLQGLYLSGTAITDAGLVHLVGMNDLKTLFIGAPGVTDNGLQHITLLPRLEHLSLETATISDEAIGQLAELTRLKSVSLEGTQVTAEGVQRLHEALPDCTIRWDGGTLGMIDYEFERESAEWLLSLEGAEVTIGPTRGSAGVEVSSIEELPVSAFFVLGVGLPRSTPRESVRRFIEEVAPRLTSLNGFGSEDVIDSDLEFVGRLPSLSTLHLWQSSVTDEGIAHLAGMPNLMHISLGDTAITSESIRTLSQLPKLSHLYLSGCAGITDDAIPYFIEAKSLRGMTIDRTGMTEEGIMRLHAALPECTITWDGGILGPQGEVQPQ